MVKDEKAGWVLSEPRRPWYFYVVAGVVLIVGGAVGVTILFTAFILLVHGW